MGIISRDMLDVLGAAAQRYGIIAFKCPDFEVTFSGQPPRIMMPMPGLDSSRSIGELHGMPTEDELLYASSGYPLSEEEIRARPPNG